jgi:hypothetical protein
VLFFTTSVPLSTLSTVSTESMGWRRVDHDRDAGNTSLLRENIREAGRVSIYTQYTGEPFHISYFFLVYYGRGICIVGMTRALSINKLEKEGSFWICC